MSLTKKMIKTEKLSHADFMKIFWFCDSYEFGKPEDQADAEVEERLRILGQMHEVLGFGTLNDCKLHA
jgi:hypothetical protein